ncbi:MAG: glucan biosynthesis glucosyltransferase [Betaproteobacteria bacterium]|nr:glucan biosynthesis glucosyltransferase [Betaproteobacteria bacterium]
MTLSSVSPRNRPRLAMMPPINRTSMAPRPWTTLADNNAPASWQAIASLRRWCLFTLIVMQTWIATNYMASVLPYHGGQPLEIAILVLFAILFAWISAGFWTAMAGLTVLLRGGDRHAISLTAAPDMPVADDVRTAIIMPIYNENVRRVFAGLRATYESLARSGNLSRYDFFVLSDSSDPAACDAEPRAWRELCEAVDGFGRIFYRRRLHRIKRKSGNVADFCRRWGKNYRYMVVLDADSIMTGDCLTRLVQLMEANPGAGIVQTAPHAAGRETLHARVQQFAGRLYGPLFTTGLHFWQLGESHYWGHNAIIRIAPFIEHCALERLPGTGSLSGEILSHDFVEAALMRRAGWSVWLAYDIPGSYEEMPPNLIDELTRDRRWCQGNLMNLRLFTLRGLHPAHRAVFVTGVMAYLSAPLWFLFLLLSTALLAYHTLAVPQYFSMPFQLFPLWPEWRPERAITLFSTTAFLLFMPKVAALILACRQDTRDYGGRSALVMSVAAEMLLSAVLAPIRMLFHTEFVTAALAGITIKWQSPPREDAETGWAFAGRRHGWQTLLGTLWAVGVYLLNPNYIWWLLPIVGALMLSIPLSVFSSRVSLGHRTARAGLFWIPEESAPPRELVRMESLMGDTGAARDEAFTAARPHFYPQVRTQRSLQGAGENS